MTKERVHEYISCITEDFKTIVPLLAKEGFHLAIATHSDRAEYDFLGHDPEVYLLGEVCL
jgi:ketol-acid reductoisomerase